MNQFGKGLTYCLGLFLLHSDHSVRFLRQIGPMMWFNVASDHLYDLQIPDNLPGPLKARLASFQTKVLVWGHGWREPPPTEADIAWSIEEALALLNEIETFYGSSEALKGKWDELKGKVWSGDVEFLMEVDKLYGVEVEEAAYK